LTGLAELKYKGNMFGIDAVHPIATPGNRIPTRFAPAERAAAADLRRQVAYFSAETLTRHLLDAVPGILAILNAHRQIVYANQALQSLLGGDGRGPLSGQRPGEALDCIHTRRTEGGCGTTENCSTCGAILSILAGIAGKKDVRECRITRHVQGRMEAMDLEVQSVPLDYRGEKFTVVTVSDISHEKRRVVLESLFFHDILNVAGSIKGFAELLRDYDLADKQDIFALIHAASERVIDEIQAQRTVAAAESRELRVHPETIRSPEFLRQLVEIYRRHEAAENRQLILEPAVAEVVLVSDRTLLGRVLGNMIKNALEASRTGETVTVGCRQVDDRVEFSVHNPAVIPHQAQLQIFQRSFSTKGCGRGLGTYSMRLLSGYLQGEVSFTSYEREGTIFRASYPLTLR
jgi:signal transduction histidine kinase